MSKRTTGPAALLRYFKSQTGPRVERDSMQALATRCGVSKGLIWMITRGKTISFRLATKIEAHTGIPWWSFPIGRGHVPLEVLKKLTAE